MGAPLQRMGVSYGQETEAEAEVEKGIRGKLAEDLKAVVADAEELLKSAKVRLAEEEVAVMAKTRAAAGAADDFVRANPWMAMGITAVVGLVLGILAERTSLTRVDGL
jgi:ElaB/YqjD/DUF883 family membrane-anchored ribosome-binding protein